MRVYMNIRSKFCSMATSPLARLNTNCFLFSKSSIISPVHEITYYRPTGLVFHYIYTVTNYVALTDYRCKNLAAHSVNADMLMKLEARRIYRLTCRVTNDQVKIAFSCIAST